MKDVQQTIIVEPKDELTAKEIIEFVQGYSIGFLLPIILALIGYFTLKMKTKQRHMDRMRQYYKNHEYEDGEPSEETVMQYLKDKMGGKP